MHLVYLNLPSPKPPSTRVSKGTADAEKCKTLTFPPARPSLPSFLFYPPILRSSHDAHTPMPIHAVARSLAVRQKTEERLSSRKRNLYIPQTHNKLHVLPSIF
mmetsp:Transcript_32426/g.64366  ORF Transcript_32426/g.64366 Transcript_32426/m.64366 type:complete len:103 (-) Transcript_32426:198-506(-)